MPITYNPNDILFSFRMLISDYASMSDAEVLAFIDVAYKIVQINDFNNQTDYNLALVYSTGDLIFFSKNSSGEISEKNIADIRLSYNTGKGISSKSMFFDRYLDILKQNGNLPYFISD